MLKIEIFGVPYLKKGIRIKKKNRGSFTKYCKGKVTQGCIDKAKRSGNTKLVKKAVFAENARKWTKKHQTGTTKGGIQYLQVQEHLKKDYPLHYNLMQIINAKKKAPHSEVVKYTDNKGTTKTATTKSGELSNVEPLMLGAPMRVVGRQIFSKIPGIVPRIASLVPTTAKNNERPVPGFIIYHRESTI